MALKVLFLSDAHAEVDSVRRLVGKVRDEKPDLVVFAGDISHQGNLEMAKEIIAELEKLNVKIIAVPGNMDSKEILEFLEEKGMSIEKKIVNVKGYVFAGLGGAIAHNKIYPYNLGELNAKKVLDEILKGSDAKKTILVTHSPPKDTKLDLAGGKVHIGSKEIGKAIEKYQPLLSVFGHVHEAEGEIMIGNTLCISLNPAMHGKALIVELNGEIKRREVKA